MKNIAVVNPIYYKLFNLGINLENSVFKCVSKEGDLGTNVALFEFIEPNVSFGINNQSFLATFYNAVIAPEYVVYETTYDLENYRDDLSSTIIDNNIFVTAQFYDIYTPTNNPTNYNIIPEPLYGDGKYYKTNFGSLRLNNLVYTHDTINYSDDDCSFNFITTDYNLTLNNGDYFVFKGINFGGINGSCSDTNFNNRIECEDNGETWDSGNDLEYNYGISRNGIPITIIEKSDLGYYYFSKIDDNRFTLYKNINDINNIENNFTLIGDGYCNYGYTNPIGEIKIEITDPDTCRNICKEDWFCEYYTFNENSNTPCSHRLRTGYKFNESNCDVNLKTNLDDNTYINNYNPVTNDITKNKNIQKKL